MEKHLEVIETAQKKIKPGFIKRIFGFGGSKKQVKKEEEKKEMPSNQKKKTNLDAEFKNN